MKILTVKEPSLENIQLKKPQINDGCMYVDIKNGKNSHLYVQTPKMYCSKLEPDSKTMCIYFKNNKNNTKLPEFYELFRNIEEKICELIADKSSSWFNSISKDKLMEKFYNSAIKLPSHLEEPLFLKVNIPHSEDGYSFEMYNQRRDKVDTKTIKNDTDVITVLIANELVITSSSAHIYWEVAQMKVYQIKEKIIGCNIIEEDDDDLEKNVEKIKLNEEPTKEKKKRIKERISVNLIEDGNDGDISEN